MKAVLNRVLTWPSGEYAAKVLSPMEAQDANAYRLTEEQVAKVRQRI